MNTFTVSLLAYPGTVGANRIATIGDKGLITIRAVHEPIKSRITWDKVTLGF